MRFLIYCSFALILLATQSLHATSWVDVGDGWFAERNTSKLYGEVGTVLMRHISTMDSVVEVTFDCKNGIATNKSWGAPIYTVDISSLRKAQQLACRRSWEFWK